MHKRSTDQHSDPLRHAIGARAGRATAESELERLLAGHSDPKVVRALYMGYLAAKAAQALKRLLGRIARPAAEIFDRLGAHARDRQ